MKGSNICAVVSVVVAGLFVSGCGSGRLKARQDQREKMVNATGLYCEWVNGDKHSDFDVELNLQMAKRCDSNKPFSLTPFKNSSDQNGILYCCGVAGSDNGGPGNGGYTAPSARRAAGPAAKKVNPAPAAAQQAPALTPTAAPAPADSAPSVNDGIVEDK